MTERPPDWITRQERTAESYAAYLRSIDRADAPLAVLDLKGKRVPPPERERVAYDWGATVLVPADVVGMARAEGDLLDIPAFLRRGT